MEAGLPRPRKLDTNEALDAVLGVFWRKGYEGTSYTDLVAATGVERPALYAAFGNKQALFLHALERYGSDYGNYVEDALKQTTAREVATHFLHGAVELSTRFSDRRGCLGINGALAVSDHAEVPRRALIEWRAEGEMLLRERFERARSEGDLPVSANPAVLAAFLLTVAHGMAVQAKAGFERDVLVSIADQALSTWPDSHTT